MIIPVLVYGTLVGVLVAVAARALEAAARSANLASRWIWVGAMALTVGLVGWVTVASRAAMPVPAAAAVVHKTPLLAGLPTAGAVGPVGAVLAQARRGLESVVNEGAAVLTRALPSAAATVLVVLWAAASSLFLGLIALVELVGRRRSERMPERWLHGRAVRVSTATGPAVLGLAPPRIVVPGWLLARSEEEQQAALAHEESHVRAGDPWLLAGACAIVALMPWSVALWYMLSRVRLAVEVDCDARVLRGGVAARSYGELLISVAEHTSTHGVGALALSGGTSHLHKRIQAMTAPVRSVTPIRIAAAVAVAAVALLAACAAELPTQADISNMDATSATTAARKVALVGNDSGRVTYWINDVVATAAQAKAVMADSIASIEVVKNSATRDADIRITTEAAKTAFRYSIPRTAAKTPSRGDSAELPLAVRATATGTGRTDTLFSEKPLRLVGKTSDDFRGLIMIDGKKSDAAALFGPIIRKTIASVTVLKGAAAMAKYSDPAAAYGVIEVTTKK